MEAFNKKLSTSKIKVQNKTHSLIDLIKRPDFLAKNFLKARGEIDSFALFAEETKIKYSGYIEIEKKRIKKNKDLEDFVISENFNYKKVLNLSSEAREKLALVRPETVGQAMRIDGVSRSDISSLCLFLAASSSDVSRETKN
tara:strand:- start:995 stop:1420 length:426 start_codon:yes stop_codon:yes gene_type:complete